MDLNKLEFTTNALEEYEQRFATARKNLPFRDMTKEENREEVREKIKKSIGFKEELVPEIHNVKEIMTDDFGDYTVTQIMYESWDNFYGSSSIYMPKSEEKLPFGILLNGHGNNGRRNEGYSLMAHRLAKMGLAVLVNDNIGQGDRTPFGHKNCVAPFYCGLSVMGMIVMETVGLIRYMLGNYNLDKTRVATFGNSGGGTTNLYLTAVCPEITVAAPSGCFCDLSYVLSKEKTHCLCNLIPGLNGAENWEAISLFAPKPLLIEGGSSDNFIPHGMVVRNARKTYATYAKMGAEKNFKLLVTDTKHPWEKVDRYKISDFLSKQLNLSEAEENLGEDASLLEYLPKWKITFPENAITTDMCAQNITGIKMPEGTEIWDVFKPQYKGKYFTKDDVELNILGKDLMRMFAQMEGYLAER